ncbi:MAG: hypothetical protein K9L22_06455 [Methylococcaceae bacterium]|nr:hypothetical protein [Methylococcaceae bacterium]
MNKKLFAHRYLLFTTLSATLIASPVWAAKPQTTPNQEPNNNQSVNTNFATLYASGNSVFWSIHPSVHYDSISLTLSSGDETWETSSTTEPEVTNLTDGHYNYELVVTPALGASVRAELKAARLEAHGQDSHDKVKALKNQGKIPQHRQVQSGAFMIVNGQLASPDAIEE